MNGGVLRVFLLRCLRTGDEGDDRGDEHSAQWRDGRLRFRQRFPHHRAELQRGKYATGEPDLRLRCGRTRDKQKRHAGRDRVALCLRKTPVPTENSEISEKSRVLRITALMSPACLSSNDLSSVGLDA